MAASSRSPLDHAHETDLGRVLDLTGGLLEAQLEELLLEVGLGVAQLLNGLLTQFLCFHRTCPRATNRVLIGILWAARRIASRAISSVTPSISYRIRAGLTTHTHSSGAPLPLPMRVSAGFFVIGLSGKTRIQIFPPRLTWRVMAIRPASIWRAVIPPGSIACKP